MILLGKNPGIVQDHTNTQILPNMKEDEYILANTVKRAKIPVYISPINEEDANNSSDTSISPSTSSTDSSKIASEKDGLLYIAGFIAKKYKNQFPELGSQTSLCTEENNESHGWIHNLSHGGLTNPSEEWAKIIKKMDKYFISLHKDKFQGGKNIIKQTSKYISKKIPQIPINIITTFVKQRIFIRIRYLNMQKKVALGKRKSSACDRKIQKKFKKII